MDITAAILVPMRTFQKLSDRNQQISRFTELSGMSQMSQMSEISEVQKERDTQQSITMLDGLIFVMGVAIGLYAAYLSFQCNSKLKYGMILRVIFAVFAYVFGFVYLILYVLMRWDVCNAL
jgi:hypothetical protein